MQKVFSKRIATYGMLLLLSPMVVFHLLVLTGVIPFRIVWGGRLQSREEMVGFEIISIFTLLLLLFIIAVSGGFIKLKIKPLLLQLAFWLMAVLFLLNTLGNLNAVSDLERNLFTPATLLLFLFSVRLALAK